MQKFPTFLNSIFNERVYSVLNCENPYKRSNTLGHITASGLVVHDNKVLLIFHPFIKRWFQPGGHIDDEDIRCAWIPFNQIKSNRFKCA